MKITPLVLLVSVALAGCGGGEEDAKPAATAKATETATAAATQSAGDAEAEIRQVFTGYNAALAARDWDKACGYLSPETTGKLRENVKKLGDTNPPKECSALLAAVYKALDRQPAQKDLIETILKTAEIDDVQVTGDAAVINWHATVKGAKTPVSQSARQIGGEWKLVDVTN